ncbi:MAG: PEP/pyruvate-binding domain-containing protein [Planctomycetota bacterium]
MSLVLRLEELRPQQVGWIGGKALGLWRLQRAGYPIPRTVILTEGAYVRALEAAGLVAERDALVARFGAEPDPEALRGACDALAQRLRSPEWSLPSDLAEALDAVCDAAQGRLAVRSSSSLEDGTQTSFAGVFHSELEVVGRAALEQAAREVWSSALGYAAFHHALSHGLDPRQHRMAIVVQKQVEASWAGVFFSREPSGQRPDDAYVMCTEGTAEKLLEGQESGHGWHLPRDFSQLEPPADARGLPSAVLETLLRWGTQLEARWKTPLDLEWAAEGEQVTLLQARPITTLVECEDPPIHWTRELSEERFPKPISPLSWSVLAELLPSNTLTLKRRFGISSRRGPKVATTIGHYVYSDKDYFDVKRNMKVNPLSQLRFFAAYLREAGDVVAQLPALFSGPKRTRFGLRWLLLSRLFRAFVIPHAREVGGRWRAHVAESLAQADAFAAVDFSRLTPQELWEHKLAMERVGRDYMEPDLAIYVVKMACKGILVELGKALHGEERPAFLTALTSGVENCTLTMNAELEALYGALVAAEGAREQLQSGSLDALLARLDAPGSDAERAGARALRAFVQRNGHNTTNWDMRQPTWGEDRRQILALLVPYALSARRQTAAELHAEQVARYEAARDEVRGRLKREAPYLLGFFDELLDTLRAFMAIDEEHHFYCSRLYGPSRRLLADLGARFVRDDVLADADDVYFLTGRELREVLAQARPHTRKLLVAGRARSFARALELRPPRDYLDLKPLEEEAAPEPEDGAFQGTAASPGRARGRVRVVIDPVDAAAFQPGEVLVVPTPNPVWTPLYAVASALVTTTGGPLSHGLVTAREYGLPAVVGIGDVTRVFSTGDEVEVDGTRGTVTVRDAVGAGA